MPYLEDYKLLKSIFDVNRDFISSPNIEFDIYNLPFSSSNDINLSSSVSKNEDLNLCDYDHTLSSNDCAIK